MVLVLVTLVSVLPPRVEAEDVQPQVEMVAETTEETVEVAEEVTEGTAEETVAEETEAEVTEETAAETEPEETAEETEPAEVVPEESESVGDGQETFEADGVVASGTCGENLTWTLNEDWTLIISGTGKMDSYSSPGDVPWWKLRTRITGVVIGESIESLGKYAFYAFEKLSFIEFNSYLMEDLDEGNYVFFRSGVKNDEGITVKFGANVTRVPAYLFDPAPVYPTCSPNVTEVEFIGGCSCKSIGQNAFANCTLLSYILIPESVELIGENVFYGCKNLTSAGPADNGYNIEFEWKDAIPAYAFSEAEIESISFPVDIKKIGEKAFSDCYNMKNVVIPDGVTTIGECAFYNCYLLEYLSIPASVQSIGKGAFKGTGVLTAGPIGGGFEYEFAWNEEIPADAFSETNIESIALPETITHIGKRAFCFCDELKCIEIPKNVTIIEESAFSSCYKVAELYYNATCVNKIEKGIFSELGRDTEGVSIFIGQEVERIPDNIFWENIKLVSIQFESDSICTYIGENAFRGCASLQKINFSQKLETIGDMAFLGCSGLRQITISEGIKTIGESAFAGCNNLNTVFFNALCMEDCVNPVFDSYIGIQHCGINVIIGNSVMRIPAYLFRGASVISVCFTGNSECTSIGRYAFQGCVDLPNIVIPEKVRNMGFGVFSGCELLKTAGPTGHGYDIEYGWTDIIPDYAFSNSSLEKIKLLDSISVIGRRAFANCVGLDEIEFPEELTELGESAFTNCVGLNEIQIPEKVKIIGDAAFEYCTNLLEITFLASNMMDLNDYCSIFNNAGRSDSGISVTIGANVTRIPANLFYCATNVVSVNFQPESVCKEIGDKAFSNLPNLSMIELPNGVSIIGSRSFEWCSSLRKVIFPSTVIELGERIFYGCENITTAGPINGNFSYEFGWTEVIPKNAFDNCIDLRSITLPDTVGCIGQSAFNACKSLLSIFLPQSVVNIEEGAFSGCSKLENVVIPKGISSIKQGTFSDCIGLISVVIPKSVLTIEDSAFNNCRNLRNIYYSGTAEAWATIDFGANNESLMKPKIYYDWLTISGTIRYFSRYDAENKIAYFGPGDMLGSQVTAETDAAFAENPTALLGKYVLVETKPGDNPIGPDVLLGVSAVESKTGTVEAANEYSVTVNGSTYLVPEMMKGPEQYIGEFVLYHLYNGVLVEVEKLETVTGILLSWNKESRTMMVNLDGAAQNPVAYTVSQLTDEESLSCLNAKNSINSKILYSYDISGLVYHVESVALYSGKCGENVTWVLDGAGKLTIQGSGAMFDYSADDERYAPWYEWRDMITEIEIKEGVTTIGASALYCLPKASVAIIPKTVRSIGKNGLTGSDSFKKICFGGSVEQWNVLKENTARIDAGNIFSAQVILYSGHIFDTWSFGNSDESFGNKENGYFITQEDFNRLIHSLSNSDREAVQYKFEVDWKLPWKKNRYNVDGVGTNYEVWGGSCYGLAAWTMLVNNGVRNAADIDTSCDSLRETPIPKANSQVESAINFYHFQQLTASVEKERKNFLQLSQGEQLERLKSAGENANKTGEVFMLGLEWFTGIVDPITKKIKSWKWGAHSVVGYGWEKIEPKAITVNGETKIYDNRILIYNTNFPGSDKDANLYFNGDGAWCIPAHDIVSINNSAQKKNGNNGRLKRLITDSDITNAVDYKSGESLSRANRLLRSAGQSSNSMLITDCDAEYTLIWDDKSVDVSGSIVDDQMGYGVEISLDSMATAYGNGSATVYLPNSSNGYTVVSKRPMSLVFRNDDYFTGVSLSSTGKVTFMQDGTVSVNADGDTDFYVDTVANESKYSLPWYKTEITGNMVGSFSTKKTENGMILSADNLESISIQVTGDEEIQGTTITSDRPDLLLTQDENGLTILEDSDGDGIFDRRALTQEEAASARLQLDQDYLALPVGGTTKLKVTIYPETLADMIEWSVEDNSAILSISPNGTITALTPGTAYVLATLSVNGTTYTARCRVDVTEQAPNEEVLSIDLTSPKVTTDLYSTDYTQIDILPRLPQNEVAAFAAAPEDNGAAITGAYLEDETARALFDLRVKDDRTLLVVPTQAAIEGAKGVKSSYSSKLAVSVNGVEYRTAEAVTIGVKKTLPKLKAGNLTFNPFYTGQSQALNITGGTVTKIEGTVPDWLELDGTKLTLKNAPKSGSASVNLLVYTEEWAVPVSVKVNVKLSYKAPAVKLSASSVSLSDSGSKGVILKLTAGKQTLEALGVESIRLPEGFEETVLDLSTGEFNLVPTGAIPTGKQTVRVYFYDTDAVLDLPLTVGKKSPALKLSKSSVSLNGDLGDSVTLKITATPADLDLTKVVVTNPNEAVEVSPVNADGEFTVTVKAGTAPKANFPLTIQAPTGKTAKLTVKTLAAGQKVTMSLKAVGGIDLTYPEKGVDIQQIFKNYSGKLENVEYNLGDFLTLGEDDLLRWNGNIGLATGTYPVTVTGNLPDGTVLSGTVKVKVIQTAVALKLGKTGMSLNKRLNERVQLAVTSGTKGYTLGTLGIRVTDSKNVPSDGLTASYADGLLTLAVNDRTAYGSTYKVQLWATSNKISTVTVKIPAEKASAVTMTAKAKGQIDVIRGASQILVTPSYKNCLDGQSLGKQVKVTWAKDGKNYTQDVTGRFDLNWADGALQVSRMPGETLELTGKYRLEILCEGMEKPAYVNLTVKSGTAKVTAAPVRLYTKDANHRAELTFMSSDRTLNAVARVELKDAKLKTSYEVLDLGDGQFALRLRPGAKAKNGTVTVNLFFEGNNGKKPNATASVKVEIR